MKLENLGFDPATADHFRPYKDLGYAPGRVTLEHKNSYVVYAEAGEIPAVLTGRMHYEAVDLQDMPVVGDWVALRVHDEQFPWATIHAILPRKSKFSRKEPGKRLSEQPIAANIDRVFIVIGLDHNYSLRRIERYLALAWESGSEPVVLLTKADLCTNLPEKLADVCLSAPGVPVHALSVFEDLGLEQLPALLEPGKTVALLGSSGVGKSTIINHLLGQEIQRVQEVRQFDSKGRHTTTQRQMFILPSGAMVIDTPGMRELQLWNADEGLDEAFAEISELASECRFQDCRHENEPGCKVREAVEAGTLDANRFENYQKMQRELVYLERKQDAGAASAERQKWKKIHKEIKRMEKNR